MRQHNVNWKTESSIFKSTPVFTIHAYISAGLIKKANERNIAIENWRK